jgi:hypothetical protein
MNNKESRLKGIEEVVVGSQLWYHDENCRVYVRDDGTRSTSPIYEKSFRCVTIDKMTPRSFYANGVCINRKDLTSKNGYGTISYFASREAVDDDIWIKANLESVVARLRQASVSFVKELDRKLKSTGG